MAHADAALDRRQAKRVALISLAAAIGLAAVKAVAGLASGSIALLSEAAHSTLDAVATALTFLAVRIAARPPDEDHPYGHGKAENLSALIETMALFVMALFLANEAIRRLIGEEAHAEITPYVFGAIVLSIIVDGTRSRALRNAGRKLRSPALEADALNFSADLLTSSIVLVGLVAVRLGFTAADALGGLVVAGFVAFSSLRMGRKAIDALMDRVPVEETERIRAAVEAVDGVAEIRRIRTREIGNHVQSDIVVAVSRTRGLEAAHGITEQVEEAVRAVAPGADVVVHVEPVADETVTADKVMSVAARYPKVQQVHNVFVALQPEGLSISLHAKFPEDMPVAEAHAIADQLEAEISREISGVRRVDTHLEPLDEPTTIGLNVTKRHEDLVRWATTYAEEQPEVQNCHEVDVLDTEGGLALVMHCDTAPGLSVGQVHAASTRIEDELRRRRPEIARITVHFEPADRNRQ